MVYATVDVSDIRTSTSKKGKVKRIRDYSAPLKAAAVVLRDQTLANFDNEVSPEGSAWAALSPITIERKGHAKKLVESGALRASITTKVNDKSVEVGSDDFKAAFHQNGTSRMPARPFIGVSWSMINTIKGKVKDYIKGR